jgi:hypothetical protein
MAASKQLAAHQGRFALVVKPQSVASPALDVLVIRTVSPAWRARSGDHDNGLGRLVPFPRSTQKGRPVGASSPGRPPSLRSPDKHAQVLASCAAQIIGSRQARLRPSASSPAGDSPLSETTGHIPENAVYPQIWAISVDMAHICGQRLISADMAHIPGYEPYLQIRPISGDNGAYPQIRPISPDTTHIP